MSDGATYGGPYFLWMSFGGLKKVMYWYIMLF